MRAKLHNCVNVLTPKTVIFSILGGSFNWEGQAPPSLAPSFKPLIGSVYYLLLLWKPKSFIMKHKIKARKNPRELMLSAISNHWTKANKIVTNNILV